MPWTFEGKLRTVQNKTVRYPGHFAQLRAFYDLGLWSTDAVRVGDQEVVPRNLFHALFEPMVTFPEDRDVVVIRVLARGLKDGRPAKAVLDLMDFHDEETGFTAMERTTGWDGAIVAGMMARVQTPRGAVPRELSVPGRLPIDEARRFSIALLDENIVPQGLEWRGFELLLDHYRDVCEDVLREGNYLFSSHKE